VQPSGAREVGASRAPVIRPLAPPEFEALFRANYESLARVLAPVSDYAADSVQEAFIEALRHWEVVAECDSPIAWVRRVAINKVRDHQRRQERQRTAATKLRSLRRSDQPVPGDLPDVRAAIARLPMRQRLAMTLFYLADLSLEDVARSMGISEGAVKSALHAGRGGLRHFLEVEHGTE
jgi:RNA polymerase sigma-70 factor, ECF subfamily